VIKPADIRHILVLTLLYYLFGLHSLTITISNSIVTMSPFFPEGFALAFILIYGPKVIPGIFIGQLLLALQVHYHIIPSIMIATSNSIEGLIAFYLFKKADFDIKLTRLKDVYLLFAIVFFILQPFSAIVGVTTLYNFGLIEKSLLISSIFAWYFGNIIGQLLITPLVLYVYTHYKEINYIKLLLFSLFFALLCYVFINIVPVQNISILFSITIIPLVLLLSYRTGLGYALSSIVIISLIAIYEFKKRIGIFSIYSDMDNIININFYILAHIMIILTIGVSIIEKNKAVEKYKKLNNILEDKINQEVMKNREKDKIMFYQSRMAQMGETIAMIAHQWRQPLNNLAILNQSLYLKYQKDNLSKEQVEKFFIDSKSQIEHMSKTIDDFREFFKPHKQKTTFYINDNLVHLLDIIKPEFDSYNIFIQRDCGTRIFLNGYPNKFSQAILNILINAKDALVSRQIIDKKIVISLDYDLKEDTIVLIIKDNAGGIDQNIIDHIFDPYFSTKQDKNGTGLGLYMTKMIIEEHMNGKIYVSNDEEGAVFKILLKKS